jgi:hypothetical protein
MTKFIINKIFSAYVVFRLIINEGVLCSVCLCAIFHLLLILLFAVELIKLIRNTYGRYIKPIYNFLQEFRTATQPLPQPFFILFHIEPHFNIPQSEEQNLQTDETLRLLLNSYIIKL